MMDTQVKKDKVKSPAAQTPEQIKEAALAKDASSKVEPKAAK